LSIVSLLTPRFSKLILKEHSQIDNFDAIKLWGKKGKGVGQKHIDVWYTSLKHNDSGGVIRRKIMKKISKKSNNFKIFTSQVSA
jgi:hypothetical protein